MIKGELRKLFAGTGKRGRQQAFRVRGDVKREILGANLLLNNTAISEGLCLVLCRFEILYLQLLHTLY